MSWMTPNMVMETTTNGGLGKAFGRLFSGDKMFQNRYTCRGGEGMISFTSCCPGNIRAVEIHPGQSVICQKSDGSTVEYELQAGEQLVLDTGHLAIMDGTCNMDIQTVKGAKNIFFGGEGLFNTVVTGPGKVVIQTLPVNKLALELYRYMPQSGGNG